MKIRQKNRELAVGKTVDKQGRTTIYTLGGSKVKMREGDTYKTNKKGEGVLTRKGGNKVIWGEWGRVTRVKKTGDRLVTLALGERGMIPAGSKPVRGSVVRPPRNTPRRIGR